MAETAAHLVDHVLPPVPIRQWVLTVPYRIRYLIAFDRDLCMASCLTSKPCKERAEGHSADLAGDAAVKGHATPGCSLLPALSKRFPIPRAP